MPACPLDVVPESIWDAVRFADLYKRGLPPVDGGVLDQSHWFIELCRFVWQEEMRLSGDADR